MGNKLKLSISDASSLVSSGYTRVQVGRADTSAEAISMTGTWQVLSDLISITQGVNEYSYIDSSGFPGQFYNWRAYNPTSNSYQSWQSTPIQGKNLGYLTIDEFRDYEMASLVNPDGSDVSDDQIENHIRVASKAIDAFCGQKFGLQRATERHTYRQDTRRIYPNNRPVVSVQGLSIWVTTGQRATFQLSDVFVNYTGGYVEITSLASVTYSLFPAIVNMGLIVPVAEITYTYGFPTIPDDIKDAAAIITTEYLGLSSLAKQGFSGVASADIGDIRVRTSKPIRDVHGGNIPPQAIGLLEGYRNTTLR